MGALINSPTTETKPVISGDEQVLVYLTTLKFYNAIYVTRKISGAWSAPENINPQVLSDGEFYPAALSYNGTELYLVKKGQGNMDIYVSLYENGKWSNAQPLSKNINSSSDENAATITRDGKTLYFSSNRSGSKGYDIYKSVLGADNQWGKPENLGKVINTKEEDTYPSISPDGKVLYFSSKGHYNMGGYDIFYSVLQKDGKWSSPLNIGYPINTTSDNIGFQTLGNGDAGYISRLAPDGLGKEDIFRVEILEKYNQKETTENE